jgi:hypothetical protein
MAVAGDVISGDHIGQDSKTGQVVQLDPSTHTPPPPNPLIHQTLSAKAMQAVAAALTRHSRNSLTRRRNLTILAC